ncbi:hypothetical protein B0H14DRAFT_3749149 [Mycena olivaceomarginata]|nr:hypothetical protein B0H14DRAFT_3749149 [Mycena olivaceomarginata]
MFGLTTIRSASISLLLASQSVIASPKPYTTRSLRLSVRANSEVPDIVPACETPCFKLEDTIGNSTSIATTCTQSVMSIFEQCFDCEAKNGAATVQFLQDSVNSFVASCADSDHPVKNITVAAKNTNGGERVAVGMVASFVVGLTAMSLAAL